MAGAQLNKTITGVALLLHDYIVLENIFAAYAFELQAVKKTLMIKSFSKLSFPDFSPGYRNLTYASAKRALNRTLCICTTRCVETLGLPYAVVIDRATVLFEKFPTNHRRNELLMRKNALMS